MMKQHLVWPVVIAGAAVLAAARPMATPQDPQTTFKSSVEYVAVDARVLDANNEPIPGLTKADFQIFEDGVAQELVTFSPVDIPLPPPPSTGAPAPLAASARVRPDVSTNRQPAVPGRVYLIVFDDLFITPNRSPAVRDLMRRFIERNIDSSDLVAIINTGNTAVFQNFTNDKGRLVSAIERVVGEKGASPTVAALTSLEYRSSLNGGGSQAKGTVIESGETTTAKLAQRALVRLVRMMGAVEGRSKAILYVSEGIPFETVQNTEGISLFNELMIAADVARRSNVPVYPIDPRGKYEVGEQAIEVGKIALDQIPNPALQRELADSLQRMRGLALDSGGFAIVETNDFPRAFDRLVRQSSSYYALGYYPTNSRHDGKFRKIEVKVKRPGAMVTTRQGYTAPAAKEPKKVALAGPAGSSEEIRSALNAALPVTGLTMSATLAPFRDRDGSASVAVVLEGDGADLTLSERNDTFNGPLEIAIVALERNGAIKGSQTATFQFALPRATADRVRQYGYRWLSRVSVKPGSYQMRVVAANGPTKQGSVWYDLVVPDFSKGDLSISGILISSAASLRMPTLKADPKMGDSLPAPPTAARAFPSGDALAVFAEVYDNGTSRAHDLDVAVTIVNDSGAVFFQNADSASSVDLSASAGVFRSRTPIPLAGFAPGGYVLTVNARRRGEASTAVSRDVAFQVSAN